MKWTRLGFILTVGMMSWTAEQVLFVDVTKNGIQAGDILLSRPYIFMITRLVVGVWAILGVCLALLFAAIVIRFAVGLWLPRNQNQRRGNENVNQMASMYTYEVLISAIYVWTAIMITQSKGMIVLVLLPFIVIGMTVAITDLQTHNQRLEHVLGRGSPLQVLFIPKSSETLHQLDQALALAAGALILLYAVGDAWISRNYVPPAETIDTRLPDVAAMISGRGHQRRRRRQNRQQTDV